MEEIIKLLKNGFDKETRRINDGFWKHLVKKPSKIKKIKDGAFKSEHQISPADSIAKQLIDSNFEDVKSEFLSGELDKSLIAEELGSWKRFYEKGLVPSFTFLGERITTDCNLQKRCVYCDQAKKPNIIQDKIWKSLIDEATERGENKGIFVGISGGEPLLDGEELYGEQGLIRYATDRGARVNINTNGHLITPEIALNLIKSGLSTMHISLDSFDKKTHDKLEGQGTFRRAKEAIYSMQLAKAIVGTEWPTVYINTVATKQNILGFDKLILELFQRKVLTHINYEGGEEKEYPDLRNSIPRLIPIGGEQNSKFRPTEKDWTKFIYEILPKAEEIWQNVLEKNNIPSIWRINLADVCFFANPFKQKQKESKIEQIIKDFAQGDYSARRSATKCYAAPTQSYVHPDGNVYTCGSQSDVQTPVAIGNVLSGKSLKSILKENLYFLENNLGSSNPNCSGCYGSTCLINAKVESALKEEAKKITG